MADPDSGGQILSSPRLKENFGIKAVQPDPCHPDKVYSSDDQIWSHIVGKEID
jgi:hypothetical protein